jgi:formylglycine-generating enzyme required for sulfatase activity
VCNGCDDDGDGADDEDFSCAAGFTLPCTVCGGAGTRVCSDACVWRPCSRPEACNACDDDADGTTDEDFDCNAGTHEACTTSCGSTGRRVCSSTCGWSACLAPGETCGNGVDDDCDGSADESPCCPTGTVLIPAGDFLMGSEPGEGNPDEHPEHRVTVSAFCMARNEVTNTEYQACLSAGSCTMPSGAFGPAGHPVTRVNWTQARSYCLWAGGALPTEAQWEKAARGACDLVGPATCGPEDTRTYPWGEAAVSCALANIAGCVGGSGGTQAVGSISAGDSPYGIHDMCANAWELVQDCYSYNYYETSPSVDPTGPPGPGCNRVGRGGGWASGASDPFWLRVTPRMTFLDTTESAYIGFRCAYAVR